MNYLSLIGNSKQFKTTLATYYVYNHLKQNNQAYIVCDSEKFKKNESQFGKLMDIDVDLITKIKVKLVNSFTEYCNVLCVLSQVSLDYELIIFDDLQLYTDNSDHKLNLLLALIKVIQPKLNNQIPYQVICCLRGDSIDLVNQLNYHKFCVAKCSLNQKLTVSRIDLIKINSALQIQYEEHLFSEVVQQINQHL